MPDAASIVDHTAVVLRAVVAVLEGDSSVVEELFTVDVRASIPATAWSAATLAVEIEDRRGTLQNVHVRPVHVRTVEAETWLEWVASAVHVTPSDSELAATIRHVDLAGVTVVEFADDRITTFRQYWDGDDLASDPAHGAHRPRRQRG